MASPNERILVVENDPDISDLIARQALKPLGYQVSIATEAASAIQEAIFSSPDLVIANLNLPGLSAKDLLVAFSAQGITAPLILVAEKGQEADVIQSFRLGANDVLFWPARDAEVVTVVERALRQTRESRTRQQLDQKVKGMNEELQRKVHQLTTILGIARAVVNITSQRQLFDRILEGALQVAGAEIGWLMLRDDKTRQFLLTADRNLPEGWAKKRNQPLDDGISSLVGLSGETLVMHGPPLQKFKVAALGKSAAVIPIKVQAEVIGLLIVVRRFDTEIGREEQALLEAVADFASTSLVNARLFRALEQSAEAARESEKRQNTALEGMRAAVAKELQAAGYPLNLVLTEMPGSLNNEQKQALLSVQDAINRLARTSEKSTTQPKNSES
ncbi:MAG: response regulator [Chloroflexi bacterium]|nr:response regulator [Chloroflexota bacterium]